ncbi:unnamed protein product [Gongylonema pulchrum]|uniref:Pecanex-like protein n=1 Tax=Gongylonema pulchrum TaxID=637853 RepID=A0A183DYS7_9BILA|nr:unnamed protein product [Gongylonema pulchrum]
MVQDALLSGNLFILLIYEQQRYWPRKGAPSGFYSTKQCIVLSTNPDSLVSLSGDGKQASLQPQFMINLLNGVLSKVKNELHQQGLGINLDPVGQPIDFSARPVDPIFRKAREQLENSRGYVDTTSNQSTQTTNPGSRRSSSCSVNDAKVARLTSRRVQAATIGDNILDVPLSQAVSDDLQQPPKSFTKESEFPNEKKAESEKKSEENQPPNKQSKLDAEGCDKEILID